MEDIERIARTAIDCGFQIHEEFGPGLLESVYEILMCESLRDRGLSVSRQTPIPIRFKGVVIDNAFRADLIVEGKLLVELKSSESFAPVHGKQVLTYLRLAELPLGLLINFGMGTFKEGVRRIANGYFRNAA